MDNMNVQIVGKTEARKKEIIEIQEWIERAKYDLEAKMNWYWFIPVIGYITYILSSKRRTYWEIIRLKDDTTPMSIWSHFPGRKGWFNIGYLIIWILFIPFIFYWYKAFFCVFVNLAPVAAKSRAWKRFKQVEELWLAKLKKLESGDVNGQTPNQNFGPGADGIQREPKVTPGGVVGAVVGGVVGGLLGL